MKTIITIRTRSAAELRKHTPSALFRAAHYRSGAGVHADGADRYDKRRRARNRADERRALLNRGDGE